MHTVEKNLGIRLPARVSHSPDTNYCTKELEILVTIQVYTNPNTSKEGMYICTVS